ncbi:uncharacterized protein [Elaeis guineensis]|uniref:Uncharacterized protein LOC105042546 n=1 Tax=Elaeis guineensis var. tenera TaxID=51953 RepID=A0A6I9QZW8_ELAGV|nr:uncharacterized protein LOC105042546 [Elaeis guineensis]
MDSATLISPSSDQRFWSKLHDRVDSILEDRKPKQQIEFASSACGFEPERGKRFREDSLLLIGGLDSVASSLSKLSNTLTAAQQGLTDLARPPLTKVLQRESRRIEDEEPKSKRHCGSTELLDKNEGIGSDHHQGTGSDKSSDKNELEGSEEFPDKGDKLGSSNVVKSEKLNKAKNLAISLTTKAASLARELKTIKSELSFVQERCNLLEEENRRFREGFEKGVRPEEDDLVRLQLEALLAEKSRLANENANLMRENQCLHQLVEYHQLTSHDISASYEEQVIRGMCLDFSSPLGKTESELGDENDCGDGEAPCTPSTDKLGLFSSTDENHKNRHK